MEIKLLIILYLLNFFTIILPKDQHIKSGVH